MIWGRMEWALRGLEERAGIIKRMVVPLKAGERSNVRGLGQMGQAVR